MPAPIVDLPDRAVWRDWLTANHSNSSGIWQVICKKGVGHPGLSYTDAVEETLCFGWIDSCPNKLDAGHYLLLVSPRQWGSVWSRLNKERVARLEPLGLLEGPGLAKIAAARADGSWYALDEVEAFAANLASRSHWDACGGPLRKRVLYWLASARQKETIIRRLGRIIALAEANRLSELFTSPKPEAPDGR